MTRKRKSSDSYNADKIKIRIRIKIKVTNRIRNGTVRRVEIFPTTMSENYSASIC